MIFNLYGKSDAAYCSVTLKYVNTSGTEISATTVTMVPIGNTYTVVTAPTLSGYSFKEQSHTTGTKLTINSNIVITYKYLTYYTVTYKYINTSGSSIKTSTTTSVLEGNTHTIGTAPTISNYNYKSCSHTIGGTITVNSNVTVTYTYEQAIMYLYNSGDVSANSGGWATQLHSWGSSGKTDSSIGDMGTYLRIKADRDSTGSSYACIQTKNKIDFSKYSKLYVHFTSITFSWGWTNHSQGIGENGFGVITSYSGLNLQSHTQSIVDMGVTWPGGAYGDTSTNVTGSISTNNLNNSNGYLQFVVVSPGQSGAEAAEMKIDKIWLE